MNERTKVWLHSMTPTQEVSKFLCNRAIVLRDVGRFPEAFKALEAAERFDEKNPAIADIWHSIDYGMAGGNVRELVEGKGPKHMGGFRMCPLPRSEPFPISLPANSEQVGLSNWFTGTIVSSSTTSLPSPAPKEPQLAAHRTPREHLDFATEHARLVRLINESNRNRSPQHPNGNPPMAPLLERLTQLLLNR